MITYAKSFKTLVAAKKFLNTLLLKEQFTIAKVANKGGDIYFIKPVNEEALGEDFEKVLHDNLWNLYEE